VSFDGETYTSVYATTNSVITFGRPDETYWDYPTTPSISLYSMDWVTYPSRINDEHLIISTSDGGFQVDLAVRPYGYQNAPEVTNIIITAAINTDGTVAMSYVVTGPTYDGQTRTGVRLRDGSVVTLEQYGVVHVDEAPVLAPVPVEPTPEPTPVPTPTVEPTPEPTPTVEPTPTPTPTPTPSPSASNEPDPTPSPSPTPSESATASETSTVETGTAIVETGTAVVDPTPAPEPVQPPAPAPEPSVAPPREPDPQPVPVETPQPDPTPTPDPDPSPNPDPIVDPAPEPQPETPADPDPVVDPVVQPDTPTTPEEPAVEPSAPPVEPVTPAVEDKEDELPPVAKDLPPQGGQVIYGSKEQPQVIDPDTGKLTPPPPPPGSGLPIPPDAITVAETFIGQPGGMGLNSPDVAVPIVATPVELPAALDAIPGLGNAAQALSNTYVALANIGADMSPSARKKGKTIVVAALLVQQAIGAATRLGRK
jgi:hypothetical protein